MSAFTLAAAATVLMALAHALVPAVRERASASTRSLVAAVGAGTAVAYVFLHLLPELAHGNREVAELLGEDVAIGALEEIGIFVLALVGFMLLYGVDHVAARVGGSSGIFAVHIGVYALYSALIAYTLPTKFASDPGFAWLFVGAMSIHTVLVDRSLADHYGSDYRRVGVPLLVAALVVGLAAGEALAPTRSAVVTLILASIAGFVLYSVFGDELPDESEVRYPAFAGSALAYGGLLLFMASAAG